MTLLMHETYIRIQEQLEFARIANNIENKNANFISYTEILFEKVMQL